jgi:hypothetical protein
VESNKYGHRQCEKVEANFATLVREPPGEMDLSHVDDSVVTMFVGEDKIFMTNHRKYLLWFWMSQVTYKFISSISRVSCGRHGID